MAKATVQAALGPVALKRLAENPDSSDEDRRHAEILLTICVLSIVVTAPIGAILISVSGTKLLTKTKQLHVVEGKSKYCLNIIVFHEMFLFISVGWRRSHRPSLYDISIIDEEEDDREDPEKDEVSDDEEKKERTIVKEPSKGVPLPNYSSVTK